MGAIAQTHSGATSSKRARIYADLRRRLQRSEVGPDDRLVDVEIATAYGTSRMPAREALLQLVNEGYLVGTTRGFVVPTLTLQDIRNVFEVRKLLEPRAAARPARDLEGERGHASARHGRSAPLPPRRRATSSAQSSPDIAFRNAWLGRVLNARPRGDALELRRSRPEVRLETLRAGRRSRS